MSSAVAVALVGCLTYIAYWWINTSSFTEGIPSPIGLPLLGNLLDFLPAKLLSSLEDYRNKYGNLILIRALSKRIFIISDPHVAREVLLKRPKQFRRSRQIEYTGNLLTVSLGLLHASGAIWSRMRRSTAPSFNQANVMNKFEIIQEEMRSWIARIKAMNQGDSIPVIDMFPEAFSLTIRVISRSAFGIRPENPIGSYFFSPTFIADMKHLLQFTVKHGFMRLPTWLWKISPWFVYEKRAMEANQRLSAHCQEVLDYRRSAKNVDGHAMIDSLLQKHSKDLQDGGLTDEEVIQNVKIFYVAGADTTAITISWLCYFLSLNPHVQSRVREEVDAVYSGDAVDFNAVKGLTYTHAVVKESMRLKNAVPLMPFELEDNIDSFTLSQGLTVRTNDAVWVYADGIMSHKDIFPQAQSFLPERWIVSSPSNNSGVVCTSEADLAKMEEAFLAFGSGPRVCPGMNMAVLEAVLATAHLVKHFELTLACDAKEITREMNITANPNKMLLKLKER